VFKGDY